MKSLKNYKDLLGEYLPAGLIEACYISIKCNDPAHNVDHVYNVCAYGLELTADKFNNKEISIVLAGCLMHDLGCRYDRKTHHQISFGLAFRYLDVHAPKMFNEQETMLIAKTCYEHRASYDGAHFSIYSEYVAIADRGKLDLTDLIDRCMKARAAWGVLSAEDLVNEIVEHLVDKLSEKKGYMWRSYPEFGFELNKDIIKNIISVVDNKPLLIATVKDHVATNFKG